MATQILTAAWARSSHSHHADEISLTQYLPGAEGGVTGEPLAVPVTERPPAAPLR